MQIALNSGFRKYGVVAAVFLTAAVYSTTATRRFLAAQFSESNNPSHIRLAVRLEPENAEYHKILGRLLESGNEARGAASEYAAAAELNPLDAQNWLALARSSQAIDNLEEQQRALQNALTADPKTPQVAWAAANLYLAANQSERALPLLRHVLENEPGEAYRIFQLCSHIADVDRMIRELLPTDPAAYLSLIEFLKSAKDVSGAERVWTALAGLGKKFDASRALAFVDFLISQHEVKAAQTAWLDTARMAGLSSHTSSSENLVTNAQFESAILNSGFDWRYRKQAHLEAELDGSEVHSGPRSLAIHFDGPGINDCGVAQYIAVEPNTGYEFSAYFKAGRIEGAGGPRFAIQDAYSGKNLLLSEELKDSEAWRQVGGQFKTGPETQLLMLTIIRVPAGSPIRGTLWADDFLLREKRDFVQ